MKYDTVIIGAGLSGLAAAIRLAHFGGKVAVLERHYRVGGLNSFYRKDRRDFDVGLHAMTNYAPHGPKSAPFQKLLRQLRLREEEFSLVPQTQSRIVFPGVTLPFGNGIESLTASVADRFPSQADNFRRLVEEVLAHDELNLANRWSSARQRVAATLTDPLLVDMLFLPLMYYGSADEEDMDFTQFVVMMKAVFCEGFCRPAGGMRPVLDRLLARCEEAGVEIHLRTGVASVEVADGKVTGVVTDAGDRIGCDAVLSSAGNVETARFCPASVADGEASPRAGRMSFMESIHVMKAPVADEATIVFFNRTDRLRYRKPDALIDLDSGVVCMPGNFAYTADRPAPAEADRTVRITSIADPDRWRTLEGDAYADAKERMGIEQRTAASFAVPAVGGDVVYHDIFTPRTVERFTGHVNGAVYGSPDKRRDGKTGVRGLSLIGTDQGFLGIVGSMLSGISIANQLMTERK
ncbi:MAG: NAD(P)/FAD-dependent oxidoreductase [Nitrospinae bacterium]|nr:NAD(P)/FAD-dependent oxidoreductase [Nitrospinota bacterium]